MPSNMPATTIRIDPEVKREATAILDELGLSMSTAVNAFLRALVREGGMPFEMRVKMPAPDGETRVSRQVGMKRQGQASNSSGLGRIAPCRIQIRQGATIVQSQKDDGAECQSWSNRANEKAPLCHYGQKGPPRGNVLQSLLCRTMKIRNPTSYA